MEKLNSTTDIKKYLQFGNLTQPFLPNDYVLHKIMMDYNARLISNKSADKLESLFRWINSNVRYSNDPTFRAQYKFQRTAQEIWQSKLSTGCTDYCILLSTFARQLGIPTAILSTAEKQWVYRLKNSSDSSLRSGHNFCECFYNGKWILVDPTCQKIQNNYNTNLLHLPYDIGGSNEFIPYQRETDHGDKKSIQEYNKTMDELCREL